MLNKALSLFHSFSFEINNRITLPIGCYKFAVNKCLDIDMGNNVYIYTYSSVIMFVVSYILCSLIKMSSYIFMYTPICIIFVNISLEWGKDKTLLCVN